MLKKCKICENFSFTIPSLHKVGHFQTDLLTLWGFEYPYILRHQYKHVISSAVLQPEFWQRIMDVAILSSREQKTQKKNLYLLLYLLKIKDS